MTWCIWWMPIMDKGSHVPSSATWCGCCRIHMLPGDYWSPTWLSRGAASALRTFPMVRIPIYCSDTEQDRNTTVKYEDPYLSCAEVQVNVLWVLWFKKRTDKWAEHRHSQYCPSISLIGLLDAHPEPDSRKKNMMVPSIPGTEPQIVVQIPGAKPRKAPATDSAPGSMHGARVSQEMRTCHTWSRLRLLWESEHFWEQISDSWGRKLNCMAACIYPVERPQPQSHHSSPLTTSQREAGLQMCTLPLPSTELVLWRTHQHVVLPSPWAARLCDRHTISVRKGLDTALHTTSFLSSSVTGRPDPAHCSPQSASCQNHHSWPWLCPYPWSSTPVCIVWNLVQNLCSYHNNCAAILVVVLLHETETKAQK